MQEPVVSTMTQNLFQGVGVCFDVTVSGVLRDTAADVVLPQPTSVRKNGYIRPIGLLLLLRSEVLAQPLLLRS